MTQGKNKEAKQFGEESLALFSEIGDRWGKTRCLRLLSNAAHWGGQLEKAEQLWQEALAACREIGDDRIGYALENLGIIAMAHGAYQQAQQYLDEGVALSRESGDLLSVADGLRERGRLAIAQGEYTQAAQTIQESLSIYNQIGRSNLGAALSYLGMALHLQGQYEEAESLYQKGLAASQAAGHRPEIAGCLRGLGRLAHDRGDYYQAEQSLQESLAIWQQIEHEPEIALVLCNLGHVLAASDENRKAEARQFYEQALKLALKHRLAPVALDVFIGVAGLLAQRQKTHKAVELLSLVKDHPASTHETREKANQLLTTSLPASTIAAIQAPGQILDWQTTANQIVEELSTPDWG
ncbi:MAG TPA: tetratricopeptide repeat protein, partial [Anaerolineae bacterium]|nr:tetratricopeptide repeat protein [Anaerolineae bacterium]